jgi:hypothetical protein
VQLLGTNTIGANVTVKDVTVGGPAVTLGSIAALLANQTLELGVILEEELVPGSLSIGGSADLELKAATSKITIPQGGVLNVTIKTAGIKDTDTGYPGVSLSVNDMEAALSKAKVTTADGDSTIAIDEDGNTGNVILGTIKFAVTGTSTAATAGASSSTDAEVGSLTAGEGTTLILAGTT